MTAGKNDKKGIYKFPRYYDIAFTWNVSRELKLLFALFKEFCTIHVKTILEPACGTGRMLIPLAKHGFIMYGYDIDSGMLNYAAKKINAEGLADRVFIVQADMRTARLSRQFDVAINLINSMGYLVSDQDILLHLNAMARAIVPGGLYIFQISQAHSKLSEKDVEEWTAQEGGVRIRVSWRVRREDFALKRSYQTSRMEISDRGRRFVIEDSHEMRLWTFADLKALIDKVPGFELVAVKNLTCESIPLNAEITGEMGNLYYILRRISDMG